MSIDESTSTFITDAKQSRKCNTRTWAFIIATGGLLCAKQAGESGFLVNPCTKDAVKASCDAAYGTWVPSQRCYGEMSKFHAEYSKLPRYTDYTLFLTVAEGIGFSFHVQRSTHTYQTLRAFTHYTPVGIPKMRQVRAYRVLGRETAEGRRFLADWANGSSKSATTATSDQLENDYRNSVTPPPTSVAVSAPSASADGHIVLPSGFESVKVRDTVPNMFVQSTEVWAAIAGRDARPSSCGRVVGIPNIGFTAAGQHVGWSSVIDSPVAADELEDYKGPKDDLGVQQIFSSCVVRPPISSEYTIARYPMAFIVAKVSPDGEACGEDGLGTSMQQRVVIPIAPGLGDETTDDFVTAFTFTPPSLLSNTEALFGYFGICASARTVLTSGDVITNVAVSMDNVGVVAVFKDFTNFSGQTKTDHRSPFLPRENVATRNVSYFILGGGVYTRSDNTTTVASGIADDSRNTPVSPASVRLALCNGSLSGDGTTLSCLVIPADNAGGFNNMGATSGTETTLQESFQIATYAIGASGASGETTTTSTPVDALLTIDATTTRDATTARWSFFNVAMSHDGTRMVVGMLKTDEMKEHRFPGDAVDATHPATKKLDMVYKDTVRTIRWRLYVMVRDKGTEDRLVRRWVLADWNEGNNPSFSEITNDSGNVVIDKIGYTVIPSFRKGINETRTAPAVPGDFIVSNVFRQVNFGRQWWRYNIIDISQTGRRIAILSHGDETESGVYIRTFTPSSFFLTNSGGINTRPFVSDGAVRVDYVTIEHGKPVAASHPTLGELIKFSGVSANPEDTLMVSVNCTGVRFLDASGTRIVVDKSMTGVAAVSVDSDENLKDPNDVVNDLNTLYKNGDGEMNEIYKTYCKYSLVPGVVLSDNDPALNQCLNGPDIRSERAALGDLPFLAKVAKAQIDAIYYQQAASQPISRWNVTSSLSSIEDLAGYDFAGKPSSSLAGYQKTVVPSAPPLVVFPATIDSTAFVKESLVPTVPTFSVGTGTDPRAVATTTSVTAQYDNTITQLNRFVIPVTRLPTGTAETVMRNSVAVQTATVVDKEATLFSCGLFGVYLDVDANNGDYGFADPSRSGPLASVASFLH